MNSSSIYSKVSNKMFNTVRFTKIDVNINTCSLPPKKIRLSEVGLDIRASIKAISTAKNLFKSNYKSNLVVSSSFNSQDKLIFVSQDSYKSEYIQNSNVNSNNDGKYKILDNEKKVKFTNPTEFGKLKPMESENNICDSELDNTFKPRFDVLNETLDKNEENYSNPSELGKLNNSESEILNNIGQNKNYVPTDDIDNNSNEETEQHNNNKVNNINTNSNNLNSIDEEFYTINKTTYYNRQDKGYLSPEDTNISKNKFNQYFISPNEAYLEQSSNFNINNLIINNNSNEIKKISVLI